MSNRASFEQRTGKLSEQFIEDFARRWFGDEEIDKLPRLKSGKNKGKIKGTMLWTKCTKGGWVSQGASSYGAEGYVENRVGKTVNAEIYVGANVYGQPSLSHSRATTADSKETYAEIRETGEAVYSDWQDALKNIESEYFSREILDAATDKVEEFRLQHPDIYRHIVRDVSEL